MTRLEIVIDFSFMTLYENGENFVSLVKNAIKTKRNFTDILFFDYSSREIILSGPLNDETVSNLALVASDIIGVVCEYNQTRKASGKFPFLVDIYATSPDNGFISGRENLYINNDQWKK